MSGQDAAADATHGRRSIKLVVHLRPRAGADGYAAVLALGADDADPLFHSLESVADLAVALDEVPALLARAEERWAGQPRYPTASRPRPAPAPRPAPETRGATVSPTRSEPAEPAADAAPTATLARETAAPPPGPARPRQTATPSPAAGRRSSPGDQLTLFG
jgi:hypothetical protein